MDSLTEEAAALVARHIVDGHCSWALARSKAARELGPGVPLPDSSLIETAVREHLAVFSPEHPELLAALRAEALLIMRKLEDAGLGVYLTEGGRARAIRTWRRLGTGGPAGHPGAAPA